MLLDTALEVTEVKPCVTNWNKVGVPLLISHTCYIWSTALHSADTEVLESGDGDGWRSARPIAWETKNYTQSRRKEISYIQ